MFRRVAPAAIAGGAIFLALAGHLSAATRTVEKPMFNGNRLDWCASWGADCGQPAADAWCAAQGFASAADFVKDPHIGSTSPTRLIGTGAICDAQHCDGFSTITCNKIETVQPKTGPEAAPDAAAGASPKPPPIPAATASVPPPPPPAPDPPEPPKPIAVPSTAASTNADPPAPAAVLPAAARKVAAADANAPAAPEPKPAPAAAAEANAEPLPAPPAQPVAAPTVTKATTASPAPPPPPAKVDSEDIPNPRIAPQVAGEPLRLVSATHSPAVTKVFATPVFKGRQLDWCRGWKDRCGKAAADDFCKLNGFVEAIAYTPDPMIGAIQPTRQIASGLVCDHIGCDGFKQITCSR